MAKSGRRPAGARGDVTRPLVVAMALYALDTALWLPLMFLVVFPAVHAHYTALPPRARSPVGGAALSGAETLLGEAALPLLLALLVARPPWALPLIPARPVQRAAVVVLCVLVLVLAVAPNPRGALRPVGVIVGLQYLLVGVCEEWSFRGVLLPAWAARVGRAPAIVISSALFALWHWLALVGPHAPLGSAAWGAGFGPLFALGVVFAVIAWLSGSILWAAVIHGLFDWGPWGQLAAPAWAAPALVVLVGLLGAALLRAAGWPRAHAARPTHADP